MPSLTKDNIFRFEKFKRIPRLIHGFSTRPFSDLKFQKTQNNFRVTENLKNFSNQLKISSKNLVFMEQVHKADVARCDKDCLGHWIPGVDGLLTKERDVYLAVNTADCVPLFFVEPIVRIIGIAHAGWKGTLKEIAKNMVKEIKKLEGKSENIIVGIGPHIGRCCYRVPKERYELFNKMFPSKPLIGGFEDGAWHLDLAAINVKILIQNGIKMDNIDAPITCTSCQNDIYFSFRKDSTITYGEMLGVIGLQ